METLKLILNGIFLSDWWKSVGSPQRSFYAHWHPGREAARSVRFILGGVPSRGAARSVDFGVGAPSMAGRGRVVLPRLDSP